MLHKRKVFLAALAMVTLGVGAASAGVTINGKSLDSIDDIVMETTGARNIVRESVLKVMKADDGQFRFYTIKGDGGYVEGGDVKFSQAGHYGLNVDGGKTNTGAHPAIGKKRTDDGSLVLMVPAATGSGVTASFFSVGIDDNSNVVQEQISSKIVAGASSYGTNFYVNDAEGGLFPNGKDGEEVFAITYYDIGDNNPPKRPGSAKQRFIYGLVLVDAKGNNVRNHWGLGSTNGSFFPSTRIATGDFNGDGKADEIAVIRSGELNDDNYDLTVYRVSSSLEINEIYKVKLGRRDEDNVAGCDVVAGDFDGDGKTEIAAVYGDMWGDDGWPAVSTFKWNGSGFNTQYNYDKSDILMMGSNNWKRSSGVPHYGVIAEAGDLDGDGRDEIVFLTADYSYGSAGGDIYISVWGADGNLYPSKKFHKKAGMKIYGYGGVSGVDRAECSYLPRSISLALAPVGDKPGTVGAARRVFVSKCQGDDEVKSSSGYHAGDEVFYYTPVISGGSITDLSDIHDYHYGVPMPVSWGEDGRAMGIVPADVYCQTVDLGEPDHLVFKNESSYVAEIQTPPYHVDYVQVPFEVNGVKPAAPSVMNMSFMGSKVSYSKGSTDSEKTDVTFRTTDAMEYGLNEKADAKIKLFPVSVSGGYKNVATNVKNAASSSEAKTTLTITDTTDATDNLVLYRSNRHVWRYPVLSPVSGAPEGGSRFMTISLCDEPVIVHGSAGQSSQFDDYNPIHEEGNLFSYPTTIAGIPHYDDRQVDLTKEQDKTVGTGGSTTVDLTVSETGADVNGTTTTSKKAANGSVSVSIPIPNILNFGASATASYSHELTNTETFTKSYTLSDKFTVSLLNGQLGFAPNYIAHLIKTQLYTDVAGVMKVGFAVDLRDSDVLVWRSGGMYDTKPDPALVLPARFTRRVSNKNNATVTVWDANKDRRSAIQLRGIWFRDADGDVVTPALVRGKKYTIEIPVYNASFKAPEKDVEIEMQLRVVGGTVSDDRKVVEAPLDTKTFHIEGWTRDTELNKATVKFQWTVPSDLSAENYDLYFVIDPKNEIGELHEDWDAEKDPGGNNVGRYPIAVLAEESKPYVTAAGTVSVASVTENDFKILFRPVRKDDTREWLTLAEFREELEDRDDDFRAYAKIIYSGSDTLTNLYMDVIRIDPDGSRNRIASRVIPALFSDTEREVSFMVSPEKARMGFFTVDITGDGTDLHWPKDSGSGGGSSGGCDGGLGGWVLLAVFLPAVLRKGKLFPKSQVARTL